MSVRIEGHWVVIDLGIVREVPIKASVWRSEPHRFAVNDPPDVAEHDGTRWDSPTTVLVLMLNHVTNTWKLCQNLIIETGTCMTNLQG